MPVRRGGLPFEATTPTGAAILTSIAERFDDQLSVVPRRIGYGVGACDGPVPNLLRLMLADTSTEPTELVQLECNIDDMSPELYPHLIDRLLASGARDAWLTPLVMKKGRPGILVSVLCDQGDQEPMTRLLLTETTTLGVRRRGLSRTAVERTLHQLETRFGTVPVKVAELPGGGRRAKPEYEACRSIALKQGLPLQEVYREVERRLEEWNGKYDL